MQWRSNSGEFSRKHPVFPVSLIKQYFQTEEYKLPSRKKRPTPPEIVEVEGSPGPVKKIISKKKIRLNDKDQRQYLVRVTQNQSISMTAKYHKTMVKPRYHQNMVWSHISSKGIKRKRKHTTF
ncbi:hypothetical protein O181_049307 [Austropuccinia psidii MF-1]|uniref:Uncharacterized protein n=1 Tax=Austropuccinia psidii MF-1 TaxID=1389203 RepID=A0A9Q3HMH5_9BASI|nr:hypothetical protein [Austropuccinia psidii MF-1]